MFPFDIICWFAAAATLPKVIRLFAQLVCKSNSLLVDSRRPKKPVQNGFSGCMNVNGTILYGARNKHTVLHKMRRNKLCKKEIVSTCYVARKWYNMHFRFVLGIICGIYTPLEILHFVNFAWNSHIHAILLWTHDFIFFAFWVAAIEMLLPANTKVWKHKNGAQNRFSCFSHLDRKLSNDG